MKRLVALIWSVVVLPLALPGAIRGQDIEVYRAKVLDVRRSAVPRTIDGSYELTSFAGRRLPVATRSSYGVIRSALLQISNGHYTLKYVFGSAPDLLIEGGIVSVGDEIEFQPTTPGVVGARASYRDGVIEHTIDGAFGMPNARFVWTRRNGATGEDAGGDVNAPTPTGCTPRTGSNLIEPLSNGLHLSWTRDQIREEFGAGESGFDSRTITYPGFRVATGGANGKIWHFHVIGPGICLSSGIGYGSSLRDVQRVFGQTFSALLGQYKLSFTYDGDRLVDIGIDPANGEFTDAEKTSTPAATTRPRPAARSASILGKWWGVQSMTQIDVRANGTYTSPNGASGRWRMTGSDIVFTGPLSGWNKGHAKLTDGGWIEFLWKDASGAAYLFQLIRR